MHHELAFGGESPLSGAVPVQVPISPVVTLSSIPIKVKPTYLDWLGNTSYQGSMVSISTEISLPGLLDIWQ